ncbi:hypothetical protein BDZ89DRAFT_1065081 [Hymenopellis radicata]|nr:hypothetical protein BDZ89DRAFT_1065081 [Hymenopellis radicata]
MRSAFSFAVALSVLASTFAHPHKETTVPEAQLHKRAHALSRGLDHCAGSIAKRADALAAERRRSLQSRMIDDTKLAARNWNSRGLEERAKYAEIQNTTCVLAPDTISVLTSSMHCNATGAYSGYTGINPDTVEAYEGVTIREDGTTDDETFLRGFTKTDENGIADVNGTVSEDGTNTLTASSIQHVGQIFYEESLINQVYEMEPYSAHLDTLTRVTNDEDKLYPSANSAGYSAVISTQLLGSTLADGLVGYITVGVNVSEIFDPSDSNPIGVIPTVSLSSGAEASASALDASETLTV